MLAGSPEELGQIGRLVGRNTALLETPINPIVCLRQVQALWRQPGGTRFAAR